MKPQTLGPPLAWSFLCFSFVEIEMGSYTAQVSLYINYVAKGDPHLYLDLLSARITSVIVIWQMCVVLGMEPGVHAHTLKQGSWRIL